MTCLVYPPGSFYFISGGSIGNFERKETGKTITGSVGAMNDPKNDWGI